MNKIKQAICTLALGLANLKQPGVAPGILHSAGSFAPFRRLFSGTWP